MSDASKQNRKKMRIFRATFETFSLKRDYVLMLKEWGNNYIPRLYVYKS